MSENQIQGAITAPSPTKTPDGKTLHFLPALVNKDRFTITLNAYHEHRGDPPTIVAVVASLMLETVGVEPWARRVKVGENWNPLLEGCWVDNDKIGHIVIENRTGFDRTTNPNDKERKAVEEAVLRVSYDQEERSSFLILPRMPLVIYPVDASRLYIRCVKGEAKARLTVYPR